MVRINGKKIFNSRHKDLKELKGKVWRKVSKANYILFPVKSKAHKKKPQYPNKLQKLDMTADQYVCPQEPFHL